MTWIVCALVATALYAVSNLVDEHMVHRVFKNVPALVFYASFTNVLFLPLVFVWGFPNAFDVALLGPFLLLGFINVAYLYPYFRAMTVSDTSVVVALFSLGKIFVPILAFLLVGESLRFEQYMGFGIVIAASTLLSLTKAHEKIAVNASLYWMLLCAFMLAVEIVVYKYVFTETNWITGFTYGTLFSSIIVGCMLFVPLYRRAILDQWKNYRIYFKYFAAMEFSTFLANVLYTFAVSLTAVTMVHTIGSLQPFFVLLYTFLLKKHAPAFTDTPAPRLGVPTKLFLFTCMVIGVSLVVNFGR